MPAPRDPSAVGRHGLGPHVVGRRVVVRRVVRGETGPSGGPALTDVLGRCVAWGDDVCTVVPDGGADREPVRIAIADIVSGKPVPPRAAPRLRVTPDEAQRRAMALFPDLVTEPIGAWTARRSPTHGARRANSVLALGPAGLPDDDGDEAALERALAFHARHGSRPIAAVLRGSAPEALFLGRGWVPESGDADTVFRLASVAALARALRATEPTSDVEERDGLLVARIGERAFGVAAVDGDWVGFRSIVVEPAERRSGLATALMAALVERAAESGATTAYLQVLADNGPALALYDRLGFVDHHRYRYVAEPRLSL